MCSNDQHLQNETKHLNKVFRDIIQVVQRRYPLFRDIIQDIIQDIVLLSKLDNRTNYWKSEKSKWNDRSTQVTTSTEENEHLLMLPYKVK